MSPEIEIESLLKEECLIDSILNGFKGLKKRKGYDDLLKDTTLIIDNLKKRRKQVKSAIDELTNEVITVAEACAIDDLNIDDPIEFYN